MGAPIYAPEMEGAAAFVLNHGEPATVREWSRNRLQSGNRVLAVQLRPGVPLRIRGCFAFWRLPDGIQIAYAGHHPADILRSLWREWYGAAHDLEFWNAARRELRVTNHPPPGTIH